MHSLTIRHRVPVPKETDDPNRFYFGEWFPNGQDQGLRFKRDGMDVSLWVDATCLHLHTGETAEDQQSRSSLQIRDFFVDIGTRPISSELARFIQEQATTWRQQEVLESADELTRSLAREHKTLGLQVQATLLNVVNGLLGWAYAEKQQYWLNPRTETAEQLSSLNLVTRASAQIDADSRILWSPPTVDSIHVDIRAQAGITEPEWRALGAFLAAGKKPSLVGELLSNADRFLALEHYRAALIEGVTAMEVALNNFARHPDPTVLVPSIASTLRARNGLQDDVRHLGVTASLRYLLPTVLKSTYLPADAHAVASAALELRHNIVHNGSRMVDKKKARKMVFASFQIARALVRATVRDNGEGSRGPDEAVTLSSTPPTSEQSA